MIESPVLEIHLQHKGVSTYLATLRFRDPDNPARQEFQGDAAFDLAVLQRLQLDTQAAEYGQALSQMLFANEAIRRGFCEAIVAAQQGGNCLRMQLQITGEDATLHNIRWETLCHPLTKQWLLTNENIRFSRFLSSSSWEKVELLPRDELDALVVVANPQDISRYADPIDVDGEIERAHQGLNDIRMKPFASDPHQAERVTLANVVAKIREGFNIFYLVCHGILDDNAPLLLLENEQGNTQRVAGDRLAEAIGNLPPPDRPLLAVLMSCNSAGTARPGSEDALVALGPLLARAGIPAVVAVQGNISMDTARAFMPVFFRELLRDGTLDRAIAAARGAVRDRTDAWMPVLFTRLDDAKLWPARLRPADLELLSITRGALGHTFISYSHSDRDFAERIARDLRDDGWDVWIDFERLSAGELWREKISQSIVQTDTVIVNLSPRAVKSKNVRSEIQIAHGMGKRILPVMSEPCIDLLDDYEETRWLTELHILDFEREGYNYAYAQLLSTLRQAVPIPCPFKGLEAFQPTDSDYFFGREKLVDEMIRRLNRPTADRFLAIVGPSGSGKSSLVRAGLIHSLRKGDIPGAETWPIAIFTPGPRPIEALATRLRPALGVERPLATVMDELQDNPDGLHLLAEEYLGDAAATARLVLVVDQFEEIFTLAEPEAAATFIKRLHAAATIQAGRTLLILTMRADFFGRLSAYPELARLFEGEHMLIVTDMEPEDMRRSIEGPAEKVGLVFEEGLPERILDDLRAQPGALPLLQFALEKLYELRDGRRLTHDAYEQIGGVRKALALHAQNIFDELNTPRDEDKDLAYSRGDIMRRLLLQLVEVPETGEPTRRRVDYRSLVVRGVPREVVAEIIAALTAPEKRLLIASRAITTREDEGAPTFVEVSHEALIREWDTLRRWITDNKEQIRYGDDIRRAAEGWANTGRDSSYLLSGSRLVRARDWLVKADASDLQCELIEESVKHQERLALAEKEQQQRELKLEQEAREAAEEAASSAQQASRNLRRLVASLVAFLVVASALALLATFFQRVAVARGNDAKENARNLSVARSLAEAKSVLSPLCSDDGRVPVALCDGLRDSATNVAQIVKSLQEKDASTYTPYEELALALMVNDSLRRHELDLDFDSNYVPSIAVSGSKILVGSRGGVRLLEYQQQVDPEFDEQYWRFTRVEQLSAEPVKNLAWLDGGRFLTWNRSSEGDETLNLWSSADADPVTIHSFDTPINCAVPQPVRNTWIAVCAGQDLRLYELGNQSLERFEILRGQDEETTFDALFDRAAWSPDGRWLAAAQGGQVKIWDTQDGAFPVRQIDQGAGWEGFQFSENNRLLAWTKTQVFIIDPALPELEAVKMYPLDPAEELPATITAAAWNGEYLVLAVDKNDGPIIRLVQTSKAGWKAVKEFRAHTSRIEGMVWADGGYLLTHGQDNKLYIWHIVGPNGTLQHQGTLYSLPNPIQSEITDVRWNPATNQALVFLNDRAWQALSIRSTGITIPSGPTFENAFWFESSVIVSMDGALQVRDGESLEKIYYQSPVLDAPLELGTGCGDRFVFVQENGEVFQWDPQSTQFEELPIPLDLTQVKAMNCTADGAWLFLSYSEAYTNKFAVWDMKSRSIIRSREVERSQYGIKNAAMSPDGVYVAALAGGELKVWETDHLDAAPQSIMRQASDAPFEGFAWMPTSNRLLTYGDKFIYVWNIDSLMQPRQADEPAEGAPLVLTLALSSPAASATFNADGSRIVSIDGIGNQVRIWRSWSSPDDLLRFAERYRTNLEIERAIP